MDGMFDFSELVKRALKYLIEGFMVAIAAYAIPKQSLKMEEVIVIALTAAEKVLPEWQPNSKNVCGKSIPLFPATLK